MKMTKNERKALEYLFEVFYTDNCVQTFDSLAAPLGLSHLQAKVAVRKLWRKDLVERSPYWSSYDGLLGGSGYTISCAGITLAKCWKVDEAASAPCGGGGRSDHP